jgi:aldose 1-epimerase
MRFLSTAWAAFLAVTAMLVLASMLSTVGLVASIGLITTAHKAGAAGNAKMTQQEFGKTSDGKVARLYTLTNQHGMQVSITDFGGTVVSIKVPDRQGNFADVTHGYDDVAGYAGGKAYFGATIGRYGNRIGHAEFTLDGKKYTLAKNDGDNTLHGGLLGFNKVFWDAKDVTGNGPASLQLDYLSKDGEEGFPGNLRARVVFTLTDANELKIAYSATTDKKTVLNLTNHTYFNLAAGGTILDEELTLAADKFTPVDQGLIPTGELRPVAGTAFDFRKPTAIGLRIGNDEEQLKFGHGYDHNWVLDSKGSARPTLAATVFDRKSGRKLEVWTTEPGIQFYTGNFLDGSIHGKGGTSYVLRSALCLETQHFPDSPNHPSFPTTELLPGAKFTSETIFRFSTQ